MNKLLTFLLILISTSLYSQGKFEITLNAPYYKGERLVFGQPQGTIGQLYRYQVDKDEKMEVIEMPGTAFFYTVGEKNIIKGQIDYPQPIALVYLDPEFNETPKVSNAFFIEPGELEIGIPEMTHKMDVFVDSPLNRELWDLKKKLKGTYRVAADPAMTKDSVTNYEERYKILNEYIKENPNSYVALWFVIDDYGTGANQLFYHETLDLFSDEMKSGKLYQLLIEQYEKDFKSTGKKMPEVKINDSVSLNDLYFANNKLTLIDYWATSCGPCIKTMPELVKMYQKYRSSGLEILGVVDEKEPKRMEMANNILAKNNVNWNNIFDVDKNYKEATQARGYPLYILVDQNGVILNKTYSFDSTQKAVQDYFDF